MNKCSVINMGWHRFTPGSDHPKCDGALLYVRWRPPTWRPCSGYQVHQTPWSPPMAPSKASSALSELLATLPDGVELEAYVVIFWMAAGPGQVQMPTDPLRVAVAAWDESTIPSVPYLGAPDWAHRPLFPMVDVMEVMLS